MRLERAGQRLHMGRVLGEHFLKDHQRIFRLAFAEHGIGFGERLV